LTQSGVSVIVTVRDDPRGIVEVVSALAEQTDPPDEIIIVDGGSSDGTVEALDEVDTRGVPLRVEIVPGANIAAGRNAAVRIAKNDWILCTDAGCIPTPGWVAALKRARPSADLAAGVFRVSAESPLEHAVACTYYPTRAEFGERSVLVSLSHRLFGRKFTARQANGRSLGFSRSAWESVGGFPEHVYATEDIAFSAAVVAQGFMAVTAPDAVVDWRPRSTWESNARMFFTYSRGDVRTPGRRRHLIRAAAWLAAPALMIRRRGVVRLGLAAGAFAYIWLPLRRARMTRLPVVHWWRIPLLVTVKDISQLLGAAQGLVDAARAVPQPTPR
jgi:glycosyltransferase involved in cell wall biosynthesis